MLVDTLGIKPVIGVQFVRINQIKPEQRVQRSVYLFSPHVEKTEGATSRLVQTSERRVKASLPLRLNPD